MASPRISSEQLAKALPALTVAAGVVFAALAYGLLFRPTLGRLVPGGDLDTGALVQRRDDAAANLAALERAVSDFGQVNAERKAAVQNTVPTSVDVPGLYVTMDEIAKAHGMTLRAISVSPDDKVVSPAGRRPIAITAGVEGATYQQFKLFLTDLERSERLLDLSSVVFTPGSGEYSLTLRGYWVDAYGTVAAQPGAPAAP